MTTERIWHLLSDKLRSFIRSRVSSEEVADDLLQEVFLRIHRNIGQVRDEQRIESWVFQVARNLITDHYRRQPDAEMCGDPGPAERAGEENRNEEVSQWLPLALEMLPEEYREAVRMYELEDTAQQEIASRLGLSLSGAKSRVQRGRAKLKEMLDACCAYELDGRGNILDYTPRDSQNCCMDGEGSCSSSD